MNAESTPPEFKAITWKNSIQTKLIGGFIIFTAFLILITVLVFQTYGKKLLLDLNYQLIEETGNKTVASFTGTAEKAEMLCRSLANMSEKNAFNENLYHSILPSIMEDEGKISLIAGGGFWPEPYLYNSNLKRASFFWGRDSAGSLKFFNGYNDPKGAGYHREEWYVPAKYLPKGQSFWSKSYMDPHSYQPMVTVTFPIMKGGRFYGAETIDLKLEGLRDYVEKTSKTIEGYAFVLDRNNKFLSFPDLSLTKTFALDEKGNRVEEFIYTEDLAKKQPSFKPIADALAIINIDLVKYTSYDKDAADALEKESYQIDKNEAKLIAAIFLDPFAEKTKNSNLLQRFNVQDDLILREPAVVSVFHMPKTYWKIVVVSPQRFVFLEVNKISRAIIVSTIFLMLIPLAVAFFLVRKEILKPLLNMTKSLKDMSSKDGAFNLRLAENINNELGDVAHCFNVKSNQLSEAYSFLQKSESEYRILFENYHDMFYRADMNGNLILVSPSVKEIFGYNSYEALGKNLAEGFFVNPDDPRRFLKAYQVNGQINDFEASVLRKDGSAIWISINAHYYRNESGKIIGTEGTVRDVSHRKQAEKELDVIRYYLKNIIDSMPSVIIGLDSESRITEWNEASTRLFGISPAGALGKDFWEIAPLFGKYKEEYNDVITSQNPKKILKQPFDNGGVRYYDITLFPLVANNDRGVVLRIDDITENELKENQLRHAQKMETIGILAGGLAHDFNNVLGGITGTLSLLQFSLDNKKKILDDELKSSLMTMVESSQRAADIVQQLLTISYKQEMKLVTVDLNLSVKHVVKICSNSFDKSIDIRPEYQDKPVMILADPFQIEQVLLNLCVNASHAMTIMRTEAEPNGGRIELSLDCIEADIHFCSSHPDAGMHKYAKLTVRDNGVGIDAKTAAMMFLPFFTTKEIGKGTGLGLAMAYNIIKQHRGYIDVFSEVGAGSVFTVYLPALEHGFEGVSIENKIEIPKGEGTILIIDDEKTIRQVSKTILQQCGYTVLLAENGEEGVDIFRKKHKEIIAVVSDLAMPKMDGREVCKEMIKIKPDIKILIASGFIEDERIDEALRHGAKGVIHKPYTLQKLALAIAEVISK